MGKIDFLEGPEGVKLVFSEYSIEGKNYFIRGF